VDVASCGLFLAEGAWAAGSRTWFVGAVSFLGKGDWFRLPRNGPKAGTDAQALVVAQTVSVPFAAKKRCQTLVRGGFDTVFGSHYNREIFH
jgi:hypothetical protein